MAEVGFQVRFVCTERENEKWLAHQMCDIHLAKLIQLCKV